MEKKNNKCPKWLEVTECVVTIILVLVMTLYFIGKAFGFQSNSTANAYNDLQLFNPFYGSVTIEQNTSFDSPIEGDLPSFLPSVLYDSNTIGTPPYEFRYSTTYTNNDAEILIQYSPSWFEQVDINQPSVFTLSFSNRWISTQELFSQSPITFTSESFGRKLINVYFSFYDVAGNVVSGTRSLIIGYSAETQTDLTYLLESSLISQYSPTYQGSYYFTQFELSIINYAPYEGGYLHISIPYVDYGFNNEEYIVYQSSYNEYFTQILNGQNFNWMQSLVGNINSFLDIELLPNFSFRDILWLALAIPLVLWFLKAWLGG